MAPVQMELDERLASYGKDTGRKCYSKIFGAVAEEHPSFEYAAISLMNGPSILAACAATGSPVPPGTTRML